MFWFQKFYKNGTKSTYSRTELRNFKEEIGRISNEKPLMASSPSSIELGVSYEEEILREFSRNLESSARPTWSGVRRVKHDSISSVDSSSSNDSPIDSPPTKSSGMHSNKKLNGKKRGRKPSKIDLEAKLERSRQSARECRARKKLRYKALEDTVSSKEQEVHHLRDKLDMVSDKAGHFVGLSIFLNL